MSVDKTGGKRWVFLFRDRRTGKLREMGLGGLSAVTLAQARIAAAEARAALQAGGDPNPETERRAARHPNLRDARL